MIRPISFGEAAAAGIRFSMLSLLALAALCLAGNGPPWARAQEAGFAAFLDQFWPEARRAGVSRDTFASAFRSVTPDPEVLQKAEYQPEFTTPVWDYLASAVSEKRITTGRAMLREHRVLLAELERRTGVAPEILMAIWGIESSYGAYMGDKYVIRSLATLAYTGPRRSFGRSQLVAALKILQNGDVTVDRMRGSWAGAMGHTQFIPTTYASYAVDHDGDRKRDIWGTVADALASTAHYLKVSKWRPGETWGYEVDLPRDFDYTLASKSTVRTLAQWQALGVRRVHGKAFPRPDDRASILLPAGAHGPAFAVLNNFRSLLRYNVADAYALAVGHLADRIRDPDFGGFSKPWPKGHLPLSRAERVELQTLLAAKGYLKGTADGVIGSGTREAVRAYQKAKGLIADGYPSVKLLQYLRQDG